MSKKRFVGGTISKNSTGLTVLEVRDGHFNAGSANSNIWHGEEKGISEFKYERNEENSMIEVAAITNAYFATIKGAVFERINSAQLEDEVYVVIETTGLIGKTVELNIADRDGIIMQSKYALINPLQDNQNKQGLYSTIIKNDGYGVFKLEMKPSNAEKEIKTWKDKIGTSKDKKAYLCILVWAGRNNPDLKVTYMGANPVNDQASEKSKITNWWLDTKEDWFQLKPKNPIIVIDPGHGYMKGSTGAVSWIYTYKLKNSNNKPLLDDKKNIKTAVANIIDLPQYVIDDPTFWVVSSKEDPERSERFLVFDVSIALKNILEYKGYKTYITRERGPLKGSDDGVTRKLRIKLATDHHADYFISIHADGADGFLSSGSHVIYPSVNNIECNELATDILSSYNVVAVETQSPKIDVRHLQVLSQSENTIKRKVLVELGFVTTPKDAKNLFLNVDLIARQLAEGILRNIHKNF